MSETLECKDKKCIVICIHSGNGFLCSSAPKNKIREGRGFLADFGIIMIIAMIIDPRRQSPKLL